MDHSIIDKVCNIENRGHSALGPYLKFFFRFQNRFCRNVAYKIICSIEGGTMFSETLRYVLKYFYNVNVGFYSYGTCLKPGYLPPGTIIGNYCSIANNFIVLRRNHPIQCLSQHPLFFNHKIGLLSDDTIPSIASNPLKIGHDVWIGENVTIAPGCKSIGNGSVIATGAVVTNDIPSFTVVGGIPAKHIRDRFSKRMCESISESNWWIRRIGELYEQLHLFTTPVSEEIVNALVDKLAHFNST